MTADRSNNAPDAMPWQNIRENTLSEMANRHEYLRCQLRQHLLKLNFLSFERLMLDLLKKSGYSDVQLADRLYKRGRTRQGGIDLKAFAATDITCALTIVQVKQYKTAVPRRFVDELRGTMLRAGARQGLLITTSTFSNAAQKAATAISWLPINLIEGEALLDLLIERQLGVKPQTIQELILDEEFFEAFQ